MGSSGTPTGHTRSITRSADRVLAEARRRKWTLATAESCTGGLVSAAITSVPGASESFLGCVVAYSEYAKTAVLRVSSETLAGYGAVSEETAVQMARGGRKVLASDVAVAVTGVAGPAGGTAEKPVGLVWFAVDGPEGRHTEQCRFDGGRDAIRLSATATALNLLLKYMSGELRAEGPQ